MSSPQTTERTDPLVGATLVDRFEIHERIGAGGFGVVYRASQLSIDRPVAIKVLGMRASGPVARQRFQREAQVLSRLTSPHTVRLIDFGVLDDGRFFYVMEYLEGETLEALITRGRVPVDAAIRIAEQVCHALQEAHGKHVVHRDLKPANIWMQRVSGERVVRLLDFGTARLLDSDAVTRSEVLIGTPAYLAPEQCRLGDLDGRVDLYALGLILFEMLAGQSPFGEGVLAEMVYRHVHTPPPRLSDVVEDMPPALSNLVHRLMSKSPEDRPESAWAVRIELERLMTGRGSSRVMGLGPTALYDVIPDETSPSLREAGGVAASSDAIRHTRGLDRRAMSQIISAPPMAAAATVPAMRPDFRANAIARIGRDDVGHGPRMPLAVDETVEGYRAPSRRRWWPLFGILLGMAIGVMVSVLRPRTDSVNSAVEIDGGPIRVGTAAPLAFVAPVLDEGLAPRVEADAARDAGPAVDATPTRHSRVEHRRRTESHLNSPAPPVRKPEADTGDIINVIFD